MAKDKAAIETRTSDPTKNNLTLVVAVIILVAALLAFAFAFTASNLSNIQMWVFLGFVHQRY